jgi:predicted ester cyclase
MSLEDDNKALVARWFGEFWSENFNPEVVDEIAAPDIKFHYSLHDPLVGREAVKAFGIAFRESFPDLNFGATADLIAEGDFVVGQWEGGGTHTGTAFAELPIGSLPANSGRKMLFTGTTVIEIKDGLIVSEKGLDDGVAVLQQLGIIPTA